MNYRYRNVSAESMLLSHNPENNIHQHINHYSSTLIPYIHEYPYRTADKILYSLEYRKNRSATLGNIVSLCDPLMRELITPIDAIWAVFHEDF